MRRTDDDLANISLPTPAISRQLPIGGPTFARPDPEMIQRLYAVGSATASIAPRYGSR